MTEPSTRFTDRELNGLPEDGLRANDRNNADDDTLVINRPVAPARRLTGFGRAIPAGIGVWVGLVVGAAGFATMIFAWAKVAGQVDVALQMPFVVSGGMVGLALVIVGMTVIDVSIRRQDSRERRQQFAQMTSVLTQLGERSGAEEYDEHREQR